MSNHELLQVTKDLKIIGMVRTYDDWCSLMREFDKRLETTGTALDALAGLPEGYTSKVFGPAPVKGPGRFTFGPMLAVRGLVMLLALDEQALAQIKPRIEHREIAPRTNAGQRAVKKHANKGNSQWGKIMQAKGMLKIQPRKRRKSAAIAGKASAKARAAVRDRKITALRKALATSCA